MRREREAEPPRTPHLSPALSAPKGATREQRVITDKFTAAQGARGRWSVNTAPPPGASPTSTVPP